METVVKMAAVNWEAAKTEYISGDCSYRDLAKKYGVSNAQIGKKAGREKWPELRKKHREKVVSDLVRKNRKTQVSAMEHFARAKELLAEKITRAVAAVDETDAQAVRQIVAAVKDAQIILNDRTDAQIREQEARIRNLERQAEQDSREDTAITVTLSGEAKDWSE